MEIVKTEFKDLFIIKPNVFKDDRGDFIKQFNNEIFIENGLESDFKENFYSTSKKGVIRGIHFQIPPQEHTKLVFVSSGKILDVVIDLREDSKTFKKCFSIILDSNNNTCLYIPKGFGHGFLSLEDNSKVHYMTTTKFYKEYDTGILYSSINFNWESWAKKYNINNLALSNRDNSFKTLNDFIKNKIFSSKQILITGASGYIGKNLVTKLKTKFQIIALVREDSNIKYLNDCEIYKYKNCESLSSFLKTKNIVGVVHLATLYIKSHNPNDIKNLIDSNLTFGSEVCEALSLINFSGWFINVGTFWQFYKNFNNNPINLYAASKSAFEEIINFYANTTKIIFTTIYLNDTYGPNDTRQKVFNIWKQAAENKKTIAMTGGEQLIDLLYIDDAINGFLILIDLLNSDSINLLKNKKFTLHSKERRTLKEIAKIFQKVLNKELNIVWGAKPYSNRENFIPFEGGENLPKWKEKTSFEEGLRNLINDGGGIIV